MSDTTKRILAGAVIAIGAIALAVVLLAWLDLASYQQAQTGAYHERSAAAIRWIVVAQILGVLLACGLVVWRCRRTVMRLVIAAGVVWALTIFDMYFVALAGAVPR